MKTGFLIELPITWIATSGLAIFLFWVCPQSAKKLVVVGSFVLALGVVGVLTLHPEVFNNGLATHRLATGLTILGLIGILSALIVGQRPKPTGLLAVGGIGAGMALAVSNTDAFTVGVYVTAALVLLTGRWFFAYSSEDTLRSIRVLGFAGFMIVGVAVFLPITQSVLPVKAAFIAWVYATVCFIVFGLIPFQGWTISAIKRLEPLDISCWIALILPGFLVVIERAYIALPQIAESTFQTAITEFGLGTVVLGAMFFLRAEADEKYIRILLIDCGMVAVGLGTGTQQAWLGIVLLLAMHAIASPMLLVQKERIPNLVQRCVWWTIGGLPPSLGFWARWLILIAAYLESWATAAVVLAIALVIIWKTTAVIFAPRIDYGDEPHWFADHLSWIPTVWLLVAGCAPATWIWIMVGGGILIPPSVHI